LTKHRQAEHNILKGVGGMQERPDSEHIYGLVPYHEYKVHNPIDSRLLMVNNPPGTYDSGLGDQLMDCVRDALRARHYSRRTAQSYSRWIKRYILFHNKPHPLRMGENEINSA